MWSLKPWGSPGAFFVSCASADTEPAASPGVGKIGHHDRSGAVGVMTSPGPSYLAAGRGAYAVRLAPRYANGYNGLPSKSRACGTRITVKFLYEQRPKAIQLSFGLPASSNSPALPDPMDPAGTKKRQRRRAGLL